MINWVFGVFVVFRFLMHYKISENNWNGLKKGDDGTKNGLKWNFHCWR